MNRKLHNSLIAVVCSSALLVAGLLGAVPTPQSLVPQPMIALAIAEAAPADGPPLVDQADGTAEAPHRRARFRGQSVRMPFFSFVPRG